jgi:hypothetical protein
LAGSPPVKSSSLALRRHLERLRPTLAASLPAFYVDRRPPSRGTSHELLCPSAYPDRCALLFTPSFEEASRKRCPALKKCRTQGLATLSAVSAFKDPRPSFSTANAPELRPSERFSFPVIEGPFRALFPLLRFSTKPPGLIPALQRLDPTGKAASLFASRRISPGRDLLLS